MNAHLILLIDVNEKAESIIHVSMPHSGWHLAWLSAVTSIKVQKALSAELNHIYTKPLDIWRTLILHWRLVFYTILMGPRNYPFCFTKLGMNTKFHTVITMLVRMFILTVKGRGNWMIYLLRIFSKKEETYFFNKCIAG